MPQLLRPAGSIVGRADDIRGCRDALERGRLVNLIGPGGVGKTALAAEVAHEVEPDFDRTVMVELADAVREADVIRLTSTALFDEGGADLERIITALGATPTLLVLDNCEHLIDAVAGTVSALLVGAPDLKVLVTSRRTLDLAQELTWPVEPLHVPAADRSDDDLVSATAVQLFLERVRQSVPTFELTDANRAIVAAICTAADGVPLVLELAAALVRGRPLDQILQAMTERPAGLATTRRDRAEHQQSLAASLDWSRRFLSEQDAGLLNRLAVFASGFTAEAAGRLDPEFAPDGLSRLVDHSLVGFDPVGQRYKMLEVVRLDALQRLTAEQLAEIEERHSKVYQELVAQIAAGQFEADPDNLFPQYALELPNIGAALRRAYESGNRATFQSLLGPIAVWLVHYMAPEDPRIWEDAFPEDDAPPLWRANILAAIAFYWSHRGRYDATIDYAASAAILYEEASYPTGTALAENTAANAHLGIGNRQAAAEMFEQALETAKVSRSGYGELIVRISMARLDPTGPEAFTHLTAARPLAEEGFGAIEAAITTGLGVYALHHGNLDEARRLCDEGLDHARRLSYFEIVAAALCGRADVAAVDGDIDLARSLYEEALTVGRRRIHQGVIERAETGIAALPSETPVVKSRATVEVVDLSDRELSVARLLRGDLTQREIADELYIAPPTVKTHIKSIYRKLGVTKRSYAVTRAAELELFD